jgi:hypothetical protein
VCGDPKYFDAVVAMESRTCAAQSICYRNTAMKFRAAERPARRGNVMDALQLFGLFAVTAMLICYALEDRSHWYILGFAVACALGSAYGFLQGAWPFGLVEAVWAGVALRRWNVRRR